MTLLPLLFFAVLIAIILASVRDLRYGFGFLILVLPLNGILKFAGTSEASLVFRVWYPLLIACMAGVVLARVALSGRYAIRLNALDLAVGAFFGWGIVKLLLLQLSSRVPLFWQLEGFRLYFFPVVYYFCLRAFIQTSGQRRFLVKMILFSAGVVALEAVAEYLLVNAQVIDARALTWLSNLVQAEEAGIGGLIEQGMNPGSYRALGVFGFPHPLAFMSLLGFLVALPYVWIFPERDGLLRYIKIAGCLLLLGGVLVTYSRTALLALAAVSAYVVLRFGARCAGYVVFLATVCASMLIAVWLAFGPTTFVRMFVDPFRSYEKCESCSDWSVTSHEAYRSALWEFVEIVEADPVKSLSGHDFSIHVSQFIQAAHEGGRGWAGSDIALLNMVYEIGVFGILVLAIAVALFWWKSLRLPDLLGSRFDRAVCVAANLVITSLPFWVFHYNVLLQPALFLYFLTLAAIVASYQEASASLLPILFEGSVQPAGRATIAA